MNEIATGFDVHSYTAKVITDAGQETSRQVAKAHTLRPCLGRVGLVEVKLKPHTTNTLMIKYKGIAKWHKSSVMKHYGTER